MDIYYNGLKNIQIEKYKEMVNSCFRVFKYFPKLSELVDLSNKMKMPYTKIEKNIKVKCKYCHGSGLIKYFKDIDGFKYEFLAKCVCNNALNFQQLELPNARALHLIE